MRTPVRGVNDTGNPFKEWMAELGFVTTIILFSCLFTGAGLSFKWLDSYSLILDWNLVISKFQIWRLFTNFVFAGPFSFNYAIFVYVFYENCKRYEVDPFNTGAGGTSSDFLWMMFIVMGALLVVAYFFDMPVMADPLLCSVMYIWSRRHPDQQMNMFGFKYKSMYQPLVFLAFRMIIGQGIFGPVVGAVVGHGYYFLVEVMPATHGYNLVRTPKFCDSMVAFGSSPPVGGGAGIPGAGAGFQMHAPPGRAAPAGAAGSTAATGAPGLRNRFGGSAGAPSASGGGYNWGSGRTLGTS